MASNRNTLKGYFNVGDRPTDTQFADLIDSVINIDEDKASDAEAEAGTNNTKFITPKTAKKSVEKFAVLKVNNTLPTTGNIDIKNINGSSILGTGNLDLATQSAMATAQTALTTLQNDKVDKVAGKGLSTNDYTNAEKTKLSSIRPQLSMPVLANPTTTTETVVAQWTLPANYLSAGMSLQVNSSYISGGTGTVIWKLRIGTLGTTVDTVAITLAASAAQVVNSRGNVFFNFYLPNATNINASGYAIMINAILGHPTGALINVPVTLSNQIFVSITATVSVASANNKIVGAGITVNG
jgi:hypothetical protein